ncbi:antitoxin VapB family protein [Candidatus Bathyarchaeota archaeon]|nr:antitoxin VapB family protein [Candidatus Bathyarchaeota archaeon]
MGHRNITISDEAYEILARLKRDKESFTDVIKRVFKEQGKKPLAQFAGTWQGNPEELDAIMDTINAQWKEYDQRREQKWSA